MFIYYIYAYLRKDGTPYYIGKGIPNPIAAENARKGANKLSIKVTGRTRIYQEDGSWKWQYKRQLYE